MRRWLAGAAAAVVVVACGVGAAAAGVWQPGDGEKVALRYTWEAGSPRVYRMTQKTESSSVMPGGMGEQKMSQTQVMRLRMVPKEIDDAGIATIEATVDAVRFSLEGPMSVEYDSEDPAAKAEHPAARLMAALVGSAFTFTLTPAGDAADLTGMDEVLDRVAAEAGAPQMAENLKRQLGNGAMEGMMDQQLRLLPEGPVAVGDAWKTSFEVPLPIGRVRSESTLTLAAVEEVDGRKVARMPVETSITLDEAGPEGLPPGMSMKMEGAAGQGFVLFDVEGGFLRTLETTTTLPMSVTAKGMGEGGADLVIAQTVKSTMKMELVDAEEKAAEPEKKEPAAKPAGE